MPQKSTEREPKKKKREEALLAWRKDAATGRKVTPSVVLPNLLVEDLARLNPKSRDELEAIPYLGKKRAALYADALLATLREVS